MRYLLILGLALLSGCTNLKTTGYVPVNSQPIAYFWQNNQQQPVIVLQAGLGDDKTTWGKLIPQLKTKASVFAYDRPGYGASPATSTPRDPCSIAHEQHQVLSHAGVRPPYVLVGHSIGGLYAYTYAKLYPAEVAGLILLDPTHPQHLERMKKATPLTASLVTGVQALFTPIMRREFAAHTRCLNTLNSAPLTPIPVRLLFSTQSQAVIEREAFENLRLQLALDWQRLTQAADIQNVPASGHYIQQDQPQIVAQSIENLLAQLGKD